jgi:hypothetical protein
MSAFSRKEDAASLGNLGGSFPAEYDVTHMMSAGHGRLMCRWNKQATKKVLPLLVPRLPYIITINFNRLFRRGETLAAFYFGFFRCIRNEFTSLKDVCWAKNLLNWIYVKYKVLMASSMKMRVFWDDDGGSRSIWRDYTVLYPRRL